MDALVAANANNPNVPHNDERPEIISLNGAFIAVTLSIILLRVGVRATIVKHVALDDYLMVAAGAFAAAFSAMNILGTHYGLGRHIYDLNPATLIANIKKVVQTLWVCQVLYTTALALVKMSIIVSFLRIFPTPSIRRTMYVVAGFIIALWIIGITTTIFQCSPIHAAWDFQVVKPKCLPIKKVYYFTNAFSIITDLILCTLPLPFFWKLKLPVREKRIVSGLFAFGLFAAIASILRITRLHSIQSTDVTIGAVPTLNWSVVEVGTGIICACVPCLKPLYKKLLPGRFFSSMSNSKSHGRSRNTNGHGEEQDTEMFRIIAHDSMISREDITRPMKAKTVSISEMEC